MNTGQVASSRHCHQCSGLYIHLDSVCGGFLHHGLQLRQLSNTADSHLHVFVFRQDVCDVDSFVIHEHIDTISSEYR